MASRVKANGIEIAYEQMGEGDPLVLVMGIGAQLIHWPDGFCEHLAQLGFRVIRFDNRDCGLSSKLDGVRTAPIRELVLRSLLGLEVSAPYTLLDMADDTAGLLDALDIERAHIVGASMGGMIAQAMAITHPHRVRSLTSIMSHTGERRDMLAHPRAILALLGPAPTNRDEAITRSLHFYRTVSGSKFPVDEQDARERAGRAYDRCFYPQGFMRQLTAIMAGDSRTGALRFVRVPSLVIHGSEDPLIRPGGGRTTARSIPNARLQVIDGMGHTLPVGAWPLIGDAISELTARSP